MKRLLFISVFATVFFSLQSAYATTDCGQGNNDQEVYSCAEKIRNETELDLNKEYKLAKARIEHVYKGDNEAMSHYMNTLTEAQRAWLKYREYDCNLASYAADKSTDLSNSYINMCTADHNEQRIKKLKLIPYH